MIPPLHAFIVEILASTPAHIMTFILDPTSLPPITSLYQSFGFIILELVFYMARTFAYGLHRKKLILLGKWPYSSRNENCFPQHNVISNVAVSGVPGGCPGDPPGMASGVDPRGHPIPTSYERPAHYKLSSPSYCS